MSEVPIISYLHYLHEVSRRITQRGGFESIPTTKAKQPLPCSIIDDDNNDERERFLAEAKNLLKGGDKGLFVGFGLVIGKADFATGGRSKQRSVLAPVLVARAELSGDEDAAPSSRAISFEVDWDSLALNIDLMTLLLTGSADYDREAEDSYYTASISQITLDKLAELEDQVAQDSEDETVRSDLLAGGSRAIGYLSTAVELLPQAPKIRVSEKGETIRQILENARGAGLTVHAQAFLFFAPIPNQLSTTVALHKLREECERGGLKSELLNDLMGSALTQDPTVAPPAHTTKCCCRECRNPINDDLLEKAIDRLPMSLSENQRRAICDAWTHRLSYVQGPPGTGKSHTITAIMLSAALLGQRVLMVSHKPEAVAIVRRKVNELLGAVGDCTFVIEASPAKKNRDAVRMLLQNVVTDAKKRGMDQRIRKLQQEVDARGKEMAEYSRTLADVMQYISWELEQDRLFVDGHERFLTERRLFASAFDIPERDLSKLPKPSRPDLWSQRLGVARMVVTDTGTDGASRARLLSVKLFFCAAMKHLSADRARLRLGLGSIDYLDQLAQLAETNACVTRLRARQNLQQLQGLRRRAVHLEHCLGVARRESLQLSYRLHVAKASSEEAVLKAIEGYDKALHYTKAYHKIDKALREVAVAQMTEAFPLWVGEMRHLGHFLPFQAGLFDLVIVDEASQVNIAEIIPAIARGARLCVVGDTKQLGLDSVGLFALNPKFEELCWIRAFKDSKSSVTLHDAEGKSLRVSKNSILDFVTSPERLSSIPKTTLNEHFRSVPQLAKFTSEQFYREVGGLLLMRETPSNVQRPCFRYVPVKDGKRVEGKGKAVPQEATAVIRIMKSLIRGDDNDGLFMDGVKEELPLLSSYPPTIGVLCFLTDQRDYIRDLVNNVFNQEERDACCILVGTTEEFQGNEREVMILTLGLDAATGYAKAFYENLRRFNVATSRATEFTYLVTGAIPSSADLLKRYLQHFGVKYSTTEMPIGEAVPVEGSVCNPYWTYHPISRESEFECRVDDYLERFIQLKKADGIDICRYNQVEACGQKRLDFVLHNRTNGRCCAVEVDGRAHYVSRGRTYSDEHLSRIDILRRAGWSIVHVPYYEWYLRGWLCDGTHPAFAQYIRGFYRELDRTLGIAAERTSLAPGQLDPSSIPIA